MRHIVARGRMVNGKAQVDLLYESNRACPWNVRKLAREENWRQAGLDPKKEEEKWAEVIKRG